MSARLRPLVAVFLLASTTAFKPSTPPQQRSAILISWDGALREHVNDCLGRNQMPNLAQLIKEGRMVNIEVSGHVTDTRSGHAQMLTGLSHAAPRSLNGCSSPLARRASPPSW
jgi:hypothetical protein